MSGISKPLPTIFQLCKEQRGRITQLECEGVFGKKFISDEVDVSLLKEFLIIAGATITSDLQNAHQIPVILLSIKPTTRV